MPRHEDQVGRLLPALLHDVPGKLGAVNVAHGADHQVQPVGAECAANRARQVGLVRLFAEQPLPGVVAAAADVEGVDAQRGQQLGEPDGAFEVPRGLARPFHPLGGRDAQPEGHGVGDDGAHRLDDLAEEAGAVVKGAAVAVGSFLACVSFFNLSFFSFYFFSSGQVRTLEMGDRNSVMR